MENHIWNKVNLNKMEKESKSEKLKGKVLLWKIDILAFDLRNLNWITVGFFLHFLIHKIK